MRFVKGFLIGYGTGLAVFGVLAALGLYWLVRIEVLPIF